MALSNPSRSAGVVERLRAVHLEMLDAVLCGEGVDRVAEVAARAARAGVAIVLPDLAGGTTALALDGDPPGQLASQLERYVAARAAGRPARVPEVVVHEVAIASGDESLGAVLLMAPAVAGPETVEFLHLAAIACLTEVAIAQARDDAEDNLRGSFFEELRARPGLERDEVVRRALRLGCDLGSGAVAVCAQLTSQRPGHVVATICGDHPGALAQHIDGRVYGLLPGAERGPEATSAAARALAARLQRHGTVGISSFYADPGELARAIEEAELVLDVLCRSGGPIDQEIGEGAYRLLFRVLASHPEEVRRFYDATVGPLVAYDAQYRTDLVGTLDAYLAENCNMNATAAAIYAHRHTVGYRLERVRELTGLDPTQSEDRERLGLGLKAYRIIAPRLPR